MPDGLYDRDVLEWSERQADLLRRLSAGERVNDVLDWPNIIEEIESVGRSELSRCESLLSQALLHLLKLHTWQDSDAAPHWRGETFGFLRGVRRSYAPSMRQRISLADAYTDAWQQVQIAADVPVESFAAPRECPFTLEDLLQPTPDIAELVQRLGNRP